MTSDRPLDGAGAEGQATRTAGLHERLPSDRWLPETIGRYRILRLVGEGGMGSVYEAEQNPPRRIVALKSANLAGVYRELDKPDEAEALFIATLNVQRRVQGNDHYNTVTTMERLAALYREQRKYEKAQTLLTEALAARQRALGPRNPDTIEDLMMLGLVHLNQQHYADVESLLADLVTRDRTAADSWTRYFAQAIFGAALSGQKRYEEAEKLLIGGYGALAERAAQIPANGKSAVDKTGQWIVELYNAWGKPERAAEWTARLGAGGGQ